ncbi:unnamed protein product [Moneuplotes crassus]|uniref:Uncharacterized protein n=1 Tax=Euplotes crassus TaxID=5936 RepID=A0AAD1UIC3_EUPCR|nr:unnamed protein product [Moneuplotes crassus]
MIPAGCEDSKSNSDVPEVAVKAPRRKYKQKMSLWSKTKDADANTLSIDASTKSSQGFSSMGVLATKTSFFTKESSINKFLDSMNIKKVDFSGIMKTTVVTQENKVKFLGNGHTSIQSRKGMFKGSKVSSLWERRQNQSRFTLEDNKSSSGSDSD